MRPTDDLNTYIAQMLEEKIDITTNATFSVDVTPYTKQDIDLIAIDIRGGPGWYTLTTIPSASLTAINSLHVHDAWRGLGIGRSLVETSEEASASLGIETMIIGENANDPFWAHLGYEPIQDREPYLALARNDIIRYRERIEKLSIALMKRL